jgi:hypothetical protein
METTIQTQTHIFSSFTDEELNELFNFLNSAKNMPLKNILTYDLFTVSPSNIPDILDCIDINVSIDHLDTNKYSLNCLLTPAFALRKGFVNFTVELEELFKNNYRHNNVIIANDYEAVEYNSSKLLISSGKTILSTKDKTIQCSTLNSPEHFNAALKSFLSLSEMVLSRIAPDNNIIVKVNTLKIEAFNKNFKIASGHIQNDKKTLPGALKRVLENE